MMPRLDHAEKDRRRLAKNERDRAHTARRREYRAMEAEREMAIDEKFGAEFEPTTRATSEIRDKLRAAVLEIDNQIADLQKKRSVVASFYHARLDDIHLADQEIWGRMNKAKEALRAELNECFPDLRGGALFSAAVWRSID